MTGHLELLPAVDVRDGRTAQIDPAADHDLADPLRVALDWQRRGARWVHLVDLDAAFGTGENHRVLSEIVGRLDIDVQLSGGIRDAQTLETALATGCRRVNLATEAVDRLEWCGRVIAEHGDRVSVSLDVRGRTLTARGSDHVGGDLFEVLARLDAAGCARYVVTDVERDGALRGPNLDLLRSVAATTDRPLVASGGISELADLAELRGVVEGVIVGAALYDGRFTLEDALVSTSAD